MHCTCRGEGEAILFIHGMPTNRMLWDGVIHQLSSRYRCFAVDLPGMGETPFTPYQSGYLDRMAKEIEDLRRRHAVKKWHVVGHDAGAAIAACYAGNYARNVACLALLSPAILPDLKPFFLLKPLRRPLLGELLAPLVHFVFWKVAMRRAITGDSGGDLLREFYRPFSGFAGAWKLMRLVRWGRPEEVLGEIPTTLAGLPMPTLLFHGQRDVLPASFADRAASLIPNASVVTLNSGHFIPIDRPHDVAGCLQNFIEKNRVAMTQPIRARKLSSRSSQSKKMAAQALIPEEHRPASVIA
jgi:pimeloyl-ACP methyl ester carboxylesterase